MPRIPPLQPEHEPPEVRAVFDQLRATRGRVPTMYRTLAHQPAILAAHRAYFHAALDTGMLNRALKEKVAFKVAVECESEYSSASHRRYALNHGVDELELEAIRLSDYRALDAREQAALHFADEAISGRGMSEETFQSLADHFPPTAIVELAALVALMQLASTLGDIFGLVADADEGGA